MIEVNLLPGLKRKAAGGGGKFKLPNFKAIATSEDGFKDWIAKAKATQVTLDSDSYKALAVPSEKTPVSYYGNVTPDLFGAVVNKHMGGMSHDAAMHGEMQMQMHHDVPEESMQMDMHHHADGDAMSSSVTPAKAEK